MIRIFLIGDSIRMGACGEKGYGELLKEKLSGKAEVYQPAENCRFAAYTLRSLHEWAELVPDRGGINYVFWNNGLWDARTLLGENQPLTLLPVYLHYMERIYKRIRWLFPRARILFLSTTKIAAELVPEENRGMDRRVREYNQAVKELLSGYQAECIDFYKVSEGIPLEKRADWLHYKTEGSEIFAEALYQYVCNHTIREDQFTDHVSDKMLPGM